METFLTLAAVDCSKLPRKSSMACVCLGLSDGMKSMGYIILAMDKSPAADDSVELDKVRRMLGNVLRSLLI